MGKEWTKRNPFGWHKTLFDFIFNRQESAIKVSQFQFHLSNRIQTQKKRKFHLKCNKMRWKWTKVKEQEKKTQKGVNQTQIKTNLLEKWLGKVNDAMKNAKSVNFAKDCNGSRQLTMLINFLGCSPFAVTAWIFLFDWSLSARTYLLSLSFFVRYVCNNTLFKCTSTQEYILLELRSTSSFRLWPMIFVEFSPYRLRVSFFLSLSVSNTMYPSDSLALELSQICFSVALDGNVNVVFLYFRFLFYVIIIYFLLLFSYIFVASKLFWNCRKMSSNAVVVVFYVIVAFVLVDKQQWSLHFQNFFHTAHCRYYRFVCGTTVAHSIVKCNRVFLNGTNDIDVQLTLFQQFLRYNWCLRLFGSYWRLNSTG